jgi:EmrB/QacA subfamily drug resistance transporter
MQFLSRRSPAADSPPAVLTLVLASIAVFMTALDTLVVTTALPVLRVDLGADLAWLEWTVNGYNLAFACLLVTGAALGDRFGRRRMFVIGLLGFTAASAAAALSSSVGLLVAARVGQGAAAAIVTPLTLTLISEAFPAERRGAAIGLWGGIAGLAVAAGPVIGGAVVDGLDWHWMFWINVPVGLAMAPIAARCLRESHGPRSQLDLPGLALAGSGTFGITWGLVRTSSLGWDSAEVAVALVAGVLLLGAFLAWERHTPDPMVPLAMFRTRQFAAANAVSFCMYAGLFGALFMMSQLLQTALGYGPLEAGLRLLPWTAPPMVVAPIAGLLADRYGNRPFMVLGLALQAAGYAWLAAVADTDTSYLELGCAFSVAGIGTSFCFPTVANAVMGSVPLSEAGVASGVNNALRELGGVTGVAVLAGVFAHAGGFDTPETFLNGFQPALWCAVGLSTLGMLAGCLSATPAGAGERVTRAASPRFASKALAIGRNRRPSRVSVTLRTERSRSGAPRARSSRLIRALTPGCERCSAEAAAVNPSSSTTATKAAISHPEMDMRPRSSS